MIDPRELEVAKTGAMGGVLYIGIHPVDTFASTEAPHSLVQYACRMQKEFARESAR